ncbi:MAG: hypothetical protein HXS50_00340 [Theionarchaea archaeon]|nr:hypothetical protein [Theionarchaea archaeon]
MNRLWMKIILAAVILALCFYSQYGYSKRHSSIDDVKKDPDRFENVSFRSEGTVRNLIVEGGEYRFGLTVMGDEIEAIYRGKTAIEGGDYVIVFGTLYMKQGFLLVDRLHIYRDIRRLYAFSVVGLILLLFVFFRDWRFYRRALEWRWRNA